MRLPQDVRVSGDPPDLGAFEAGVDVYRRRYDDARRRDDFQARAEALWGLVARGSDSHPWCLESVQQDDLERVEDAAGVLAWIGVPPDAVARLVDLVERLPDGSARDAAFAALPAADAERFVAADDAAATREAPRGELLAGARDPFTETIYFVRVPHAELARRFPEWSADWASRYALRNRRGSLLSLLDLLEPVAIPSWKWLMVEAGPEWTAIFSQGSDLSFVQGFAGRLRTQVLRTSYAPHVKVGRQVQRFGGTAFWLLDGSRDDLLLHYLRVVQASRGDSGWSWELSGEPQSFEEPERYGERLIARRFDLDMLNRYCRALGIARGDPAFYGPRATLVEEDTTGWPQRPDGVRSADWRATRRPQPAG